MGAVLLYVKSKVGCVKIAKVHQTRAAFRSLARNGSLYSICIHCILTNIKEGKEVLIKPLPRIPITSLRSKLDDGHNIESNDYTAPIVIPFSLSPPSTFPFASKPYPFPSGADNVPSAPSSPLHYITIVSPSQSESVIIGVDLKWSVCELERRCSLLFDSRSITASDQINQTAVAPKNLLVNDTKGNINNNKRTQFGANTESFSPSPSVSPSANNNNVSSPPHLSVALTPSEMTQVVNVLRENEDLSLGYQNDWEWLELHVSDAQIYEYKKDLSYESNNNNMNAVFHTGING